MLDAPWLNAAYIASLELFFVATVSKHMQAY